MPMSELLPICSTFKSTWRSFWPRSERLQRRATQEDIISELTAEDEENSMRARGVLETAIYCSDLDAAEQFYATILGLECFARVEDRHAFFRCGEAVFLVFNPESTREHQAAVSGVPVPLHGASGEGHVAFRAEREELAQWRAHLNSHGVAVEADFPWPGGGHSIYFRDPGGNSVEIATPEVWGLPES